MGGTRCNFRKCHVNTTKFPLIHFFRFPQYDLKRYGEWRKYAEMEHMQNFSTVKRKNICICARHFRIEYFMNYKMDRLNRNAVPTLDRLTNELALDYELDLEHGVLITLEKTKLEHLIAPDNFESPLHLENDELLLKRLNKLQIQQGSKNIDKVDKFEYMVEVNPPESEEASKEKCEKNSANYVEILETKQVIAPFSKRTWGMIKDAENDEVSVISNKKYKILNTTNSKSSKTNNATSVVLTSRPLVREFNCETVDSDDIEYVQADDFENITELENDEEHQLLSADEIDSNIVEDEDYIELVEIHRDINNHQYDFHSNESDSTIVQLKSCIKKEDTFMTNALNNELIKVRQELLDLKNRTEDYNLLQIKLSMLETENADLKSTHKEMEKIKKKLLFLQMENNNLKKTVKENKTLKDKLQEYIKENTKLKQEATSVTILKAELISRQQETKELKKLLESLKCSQQKQEFESCNSDLKNERSKNLATEQKLQDEITVLKGNLKLSKKQLGDTELKLKEALTDLNSEANEKDGLKDRLQKLKELNNNLQNDFDIKQNDFKLLKIDYDNLQQRYSKLEQKYLKLQGLENQETTVTTSIQNTNKNPTSVSANALTKSQLFIGIKRYLSAAMVSLLRMEMFGSSEREWKSDECQIAVDILRLGEPVYEYFVDEWRIRLPPLRDVRNLLSQSLQLVDNGEVP